MKTLLIQKEGKFNFKVLEINNDDYMTTYRMNVKLAKNTYRLACGVLIQASNIVFNDDMILSMDIETAFIGNAKKPRVLLPTEKYKIGDIYEDGVIMRFGKSWVEYGENVAYAYFSAGM